MEQLIKLAEKRGIYIENRRGCIVKIKKVWFDEKSVFLSIISAGSLIKKYGINGGFFEGDCPFGKEWEISRLLEIIDFNNGYLDASLYLGWRLIVNEKAVKLFEKKDSSWEEDYW